MLAQIENSKLKIENAGPRQRAFSIFNFQFSIRATPEVAQ